MQEQMVKDVIELMYSRNNKVKFKKNKISVQGSLAKYSISLEDGSVYYKNKKLCINKREGSTNGSLIFSETFSKILNKDRMQIPSLTSLIISEIDYLLNDDKDTSIYCPRNQIKHIDEPPVRIGNIIPRDENHLTRILEREIERELNYLSRYFNIVLIRRSPNQTIEITDDTFSGTIQGTILEKINSGFRITYEAFQQFDIRTYILDPIENIKNFILETYITARRQRGKIGRYTSFDKEFDGLLAISEARKYKKYYGLRSKKPIKVKDNLSDIYTGLLQAEENILTAGFNPNILLTNPHFMTVLINADASMFHSTIGLLSTTYIPENKLLLYDPRQCIIFRNEPVVRSMERPEYNDHDFLVSINVGYNILDPRGLQLIEIQEG